MKIYLSAVAFYHFPLQNVAERKYTEKVYNLMIQRKKNIATSPKDISLSLSFSTSSGFPPETYIILILGNSFLAHLSTTLKAIALFGHYFGANVNVIIQHVPFSTWVLLLTKYV